MIASSDEAAPAASPDHPAVFKCAGCGLILTDSLCIVYQDEQSYAFSGINNATVEDQLVVSSDSHDVGCTYARVSCEGCQRHLGRMYCCTDPSRDHLRNLYSLEPSSLTQYVLGNPSVGAPVSEETIPALLPLTKIMYLLVGLEERLGALEARP